jgi:hypothetical protein
MDGQWRGRLYRGIIKLACSKKYYTLKLSVCPVFVVSMTQGYVKAKKHGGRKGRRYSTILRLVAYLTCIVAMSAWYESV